MPEKVDRTELQHLVEEEVRRRVLAGRPLLASAVKDRVTRELTRRKLAVKQSHLRAVVERAVRKEQRLKRFHAGVRWARISPFKVRPVTDLIRGKDVNTADAILKNMAPRGAAIQKKLLGSALANATYLTGAERVDLDVNRLHVVEARVDPGPIMYRARPSSERHPYRIRKRFCHIWLTLKEREPALPKKERGRKRRAEKAGSQPKAGPEATKSAPAGKGQAGGTPAPKEAPAGGKGPEKKPREE